MLQSDTYTVTELAVLPDGRVLSGSGDGTLQLWEDFESGKSRVLKGRTGWGWGWGGVRALAVLP